MKRLLSVLAATWLGVTVAAGCQDQREITRYSVPRSHSARPAPHAEPGPGDPNPNPDPHALPQGRQRMLAAIIPDDGRTWFFKLVGPDELVAGHADEFRELVTSVRFQGASPQWKLPEGWHARPASGMRYATIAIDTTGEPLELTVTPLRTPPGDFRDYVAMNVDRWRQQLGLTPTSPEKLFGAGESPGELTEVKLGDGDTALLADLVGESGSGTRGDSEGMSPHPPLGGAARAAGPAGRAAGPRLAYESPPGWTPGKAGGMRQAAFEVSEGTQKAEITAIALAASSGDLLANVNRWREQVHLDPVKPEELPRQLEDFPVGGVTGHRVKLLAPADDRPREGILGVICTHGDQAWFFKMKGDAELVEREQERFNSFVRSVRFEARDGAADGQ
jgi:hypothetical protein